MNKDSINEGDIVENVFKAWSWFLSFISPQDWQKRREYIDSKLTIKLESNEHFMKSLGDGMRQVMREDLISWYLYLVDVIIHEPIKYEYFQGARILPIFQRFGKDLDLLKSISGIDKKIRELLRRRQSEADAFLFEMLTALLWARNGYDVSFVDEGKGVKSSDLIASKNGKTWNIECKRQSKTSQYTYKETHKRQKMITYLGDSLLRLNLLLEITFHVELEKLPDTYLRDLLENKLALAIPGKIVSDDTVDITLNYVDISAIRAHLEKYHVKYGSPSMNFLIGGKPIDGKAFTCSIDAKYVLRGEGMVNNVYVSDIRNAYGVYWGCDAEEALWAKARDVKSQIHSAIEQFHSNDTGIIHIGLETLDGPDVELIRFEKIKGTIESILPGNRNLKWVYCTFFQAYSPPDQVFTFDETVSYISISGEIQPLSKTLMISDKNDSQPGIAHWNLPPPDFS